jgi:hypothetical protein
MGKWGKASRRIIAEIAYRSAEAWVEGIGLSELYWLQH